MESAKWENIKETFAAAVELTDSERARFLENSGEEIRREVEKLLSAHEKAVGFIDEPLFSLNDSPENGFEEDFTGREIDDYVILEKIGEGGMGAVFLAEHRAQEFSQKVALKLIKRGMDTGAVLKRFLMERQILATLEHPNIARLLDGGATKDGLPYFVMEYVEGESIKKFCENHVLDTRERLALFQKVCGAVSYAHQKLVIHRDLKPSNIIVTDAGEPKLLDFGIAKLLIADWNASTTEATATNFRLMTPEYASPEQLRGQMTTTATDVYSLGVVLYELLTGARPFNFKSKNPVTVSEEVLTKEPLPPSSALISTFDKETIQNKGQRTKNEQQNPKSKIQNPKSLKGDLDNIILKAIRREPERRYQSVGEFCDDINRYLNNLPVKATADSRFYRVGKFYNRHRAGVLSGIAISLLLIASTVFSGWQFFLAKREKAKSEKRFSELRQVAKSLLNDTNAALEKMPRSIELRRSILEKSVAVLDSLSKDETSDADFLNELADAYDKLGYIQNWSFRETENALENYQKSLDLREKSLSTTSDKIAVRKKMVQTLGGFYEVYSLLGNSEKVLEFGEKARNNYLEIFKLEPENAENLWLISAEMEKNADYLQEAGRKTESSKEYRQSMNFVERAIEVRQNDLNSSEEKTQLVFYWMQKGNLLEKTGRDDEALKIYERAADFAEEIYRADPTQKFAFNHTGRTHRLMGDIYKRRGDFRKALEMYQFSLNLIEKNINNPHLDARNLNYAESINRLRIGAMLDKLGRKREAAEIIEDGLKIFRLRLKTYADDATEVAFGPELLNIASEYFIANNKTEEGVQLWEDFADFTEKFVEKNPEDGNLINNKAYAFQKIGDAITGFDETTHKMKIGNSENRRRANIYYEKSLEILRSAESLSAPNYFFKKKEADLIEKIEKCKSN
ncbi:MAG: serine/threonine-protein kinase [Pyrinomonadaceae bacterium]